MDGSSLAPVTFTTTMDDPPATAPSTPPLTALCHAPPREPGQGRLDLPTCGEEDFWLVVEKNHLNNYELVSWDDDSNHRMEKDNMLQTTNQAFLRVVFESTEWEKSEGNHKKPGRAPKSPPQKQIYK